MTDRVCVAYHSREIDTRVSCPRRAVVEFGSVALCEEHLDVLESGRELKAAYCAAVLELAIRRGIRRWTDLSLHLKTHGYDFKPSRHSNWAYGRHAVDSTLPPALRDALALTDEEAVELATAFAYGQDERITDL